jgi:hypothetical protein
LPFFAAIADEKDSSICRIEERHMYKIPMFLFIAVSLFAFSEKYLFETSQSCNRCIEEWAREHDDKKKSYECRPKSSVQPEGICFILMRYRDSRTESLTESSGGQDDWKYRHYRKSSGTGGQKGLAEEEVRALCPRYYSSLR